MVTRKSDGGPPADKNGQRPGSYVKISGSRRRRKGKKQGAGAATASSASPAVPRDEHGADPKDGDDDLLDYAVDDLRPARSSPSNRSSWRPPGPLGMDEPRIDASQAEEHPVAGDPGALGQVALQGPSGPDNHNQSLTEGLTPEQKAQIDEELARELSEPPPPPPLARAPSEPPRPPRQRTPEDVRPAVLLRSDPRLGEPTGDEVPRPSLSSVFGARPSLRPSPTPPPSRFSLLVWIAVAVMVAIIAAAVVVAVRETMREQPVQSRSAPAAPAPQHVGAPPVVQQATPVAPEVLLAPPRPDSARATDAPTPTTTKRAPARPVRPVRPRRAAPAPPTAVTDAPVDPGTAPPASAAPAAAEPTPAPPPASPAPESSN